MRRPRAPVNREQVDAAAALVGRVVRFAHQSDEAAYRVVEVRADGMVAIDGMVGYFAPHLFVVLPGARGAAST